MKKLILVITAFFLFGMFTACDNATTQVVTTAESLTTESITTTQSTQTTVLETTSMGVLSTPTNIQITNNVITFTEVDNATKYRIFLYEELTGLSGEFNITSGFDLSLLMDVGDYSYQLKATAPGYLDSELSELTNFSIVDESRTNILVGDDMNNLEYVRWLGRTYYNSLEQAKYFFFTASGFEVTFFGTELQVTIQANNYLLDSKQAYVVVFIDGEENPNNGTTIRLTEGIQTITLASGLENGFHTLKLLKRSEASDSDTSIVQIETNGYFTTPPAAKTFRIQYIAASSSTGYGNLGTLSDGKTTTNSDGLRAYAFLTSYLLDADTSIFAASGWGVSRGYNTNGNISATQNIPNAFVNIAINDTNRVFEVGDWDFTDYIPDVIVINLGTNDFNASGYTSMSTIDKAAMSERFITDYVNFLVLLNNMYPNAKLIVAYGLMNEATTLGTITQTVITNANNTIGYTAVFEFLMEAAGSNSNAFGVGYHPNVQTSMNVAEDLAELIHTITGREILRDMIDNE
ncbi:MAG: hypothetical protein JEZ05_05920 [Tenericutes bacterium]|nr:hypothetical protein [Mycoplasmatota bacterium]